jgi:DNA-binding response OmpR family regulator
MNYQTYVFHRNGPTATSAPVMHASRQRTGAPIRLQTVLVVDDEESLCELMRVSLQRQGYRVLIAHDGAEALRQLAEHKLDLVLLDVMMPGMDGFTTCTEIRKLSDVPIVMLTALNRPDDIIAGFNLGADDYITKPFTFREVLVRIHAIMRRMSWNQVHEHGKGVSIADVVIDEDQHEVRVRGELVHLTPIEFHLLRYLMDTPDLVVSKEDLFRKVWGYDVGGGTNLVEVAIRRLREKIEKDPSQPAHLVTVRGSGYLFSSQPELAAVPVSREEMSPLP